MLNVMGHELDFDITAPDDLDRYLRCGEEMSARAAEAPPMPETVTTPEHLRAYTEWCRAYCKICTDWIDAVFGEGIANKLLGPKTSVAKLLDVCDAIQAAATKQGEMVGLHIKKFTPNRATRRAQRKRK